MTINDAKRPATTRGYNAARSKVLDEAAQASRHEGINAAAQVIVQAVDRGEITERQGKNLVKLVASAHEMRTRLAPTPIADDHGNMIGEVRELDDGRWNALCYGPKVRTGGVIVATLDAAVRHVRAESTSQ